MLGVPGLRWDELSAAGTPHLWKLAAAGSTGALIVRGADEVTPAADGWGTLSAGNRVRVPGGLADVRPPPGPAVAPAQYPGMAALRAAQAPKHTGAKPGAFGEAARQGGRCSTAVGGAGALLAASDAAGRVFGYGAEVGEHPCPLTVAESELSSGASPPQRLAAADTLAGRLADLRRDADTLLVVSLSDPPGGGAHVGVAIAVGPGFAAGTELTSASTGRVPFVQLVDVAPTLLDLLGIEAPASMIGQSWGTTSAAVSLDRRQARYADLDTAARQVRRAVPLVMVPAVGAAAVLLGAGGALLALGTRTGRPRLAARGRLVARLTAYYTAALPVACFLANLVPWWRGSAPVVPAALMLTVAVADLLVVGVAVAGPWRRDAPMGPFTVVAFVTFAVLVVDVVSGAHLQLSSVLGYNPLVAGRFSGIGNPAFAALAAAALLTATLLAVRLPRPVLTVAVIGAVAVLTDGAPRFGADVGGVIALVPAFALLAAAASGRRPTWRGVLVAGGSTVALVAVFAAVDLARPSGSRTHLGRFAADLLGGGDGETLRRKWDADAALLTRNIATLLVLPVAVGFSVLLARAGKVLGTVGFVRALGRLPLLRAGLWGCVVAAGLGLVANDSGVVVPAVMMLLAVPAGVLAATDGVLAAPDVPAGPDGPASTGRDQPALAGPDPPSPT